MARDERTSLPFQEGRGLVAQWIRHEHLAHAAGAGLQSGRGVKSVTKLNVAVNA
jgi:hypothetical protein